jgi:5-methylcytosine-specific restriction endonuclease McrA
VPQVCNVDGCPELVVSRGRCERHPIKTRSPSSRVTGTHRWRVVKAGVLRRDRYRCAYCGETATTVDHRVPVIDGGAEYDEANLVASCVDCNLRKGDRAAP